MILKFRLIIISLISTYLCLVAVYSIEAIQTKPIIQLLESNADGVTIKLEIPEFQFKTIEHEGTQFHTISFPESGYTSEEGRPQLPVAGTLVGVPTDAEFNLQILDSDYSVHSNYNIYPTPRSIIRRDAKGSEYPDIEFYLDKDFYATNKFYPQQLVQLGFTGFIRDARVLQIQFHPVQYNPATQTVRLYRRLIAKVTFRYSKKTPAINPSLPRPESKFYENILSGNILNYDSAKSWRKASSSIATRQAQRAAPALQNGRVSSNVWSPALLISSSPAYKIIIDSDGMYHITYEQLKEEYVKLEGIDPRTFKLFNKGRGVPIYVRGEDDGSFDEGDEIIFRGLRNRGKETYYDPYSDENVYWLYWNGAPGLRMAKRSVNFEAKDAQLYRKFRSLAHVEVDNTFTRLAEVSEVGGAQAIPIRGGVFKRVGGVLTMPSMPKDSWYWGIISSPSIKQFTFQLPNVAETSLNAIARVMLRGRTEHPAPLDHHTRVWLNEEVLLEDARWNGQSEHLIERNDISQDFLRSGKNVITIASPGDTEAGDVDQVLLNWIEVEYWREFAAVDNYLEFSVPIATQYLPNGEISKERQNFRLVISNFSNPNIEIYGVDGSIYTDNFVQEDIQKPGTYQVRFLDSQTASARSHPEYRGDSFSSSPQYIALTPDKFKSPTEVIKNEPSNLRSSNNGADYIIITHKSLYPGVLPLAQWRQESAAGLRVEVVKVEDIYDEFNFGIFNPYAIKDFLAYAYFNWQSPAPSYVVLVGDANFQYKKDINFVPTILVQTPKYGAAASDNQFVTVSGIDSLPDMQVSRIPVRNLVELNTVVEKIIEYERSPKMGPWRNRLLFLAGVGSTFTQQSEMLTKRRVGPDFQISKIYTNDPKSPYYGGTREVIQNMSDGALIVNFFGHGGGSIWSDNRMLGLEDIPLLENGRKLPFVISMTCFTGYFDNPHGSSLAEDMIKSENGGAIAFFGSTGLGWLLGDYMLAMEIFDSMFKSNPPAPQGLPTHIVQVGATRQAGINTIGQIITNGKIQFLTKNPGYVDLAEIFTLFGDAALTLGRPKLSVSLDVTPSIDKGGILQARGTVEAGARPPDSLSNQIFNGKAEIIVSDPNTREISRVSEIDVLNNQFETQIPLPDDIKAGVGIVRAYVWETPSQNGGSLNDGSGYTTYTIGGPNITNIHTDPQTIPPNEPVYLLAEIKSTNPIVSAICYYRPSAADKWLQIEMKRFSEDTFKTISALPGYSTFSTTSYYIEAIDSQGGKSRTPNRIFSVVKNPDLTVSSKDIHWTVDTSPILSATVKNIGQLEAKNVVVQFYNGPPENGARIGADKIIPGLKPGESATVEVQWQPETNRDTVFVVVDPKVETGRNTSGKIVEYNESNNIASRDIFKDKFILTPAQGSNGEISSVDGNLLFELPQGAIDTNAVLTINLIANEAPNLERNEGTESSRSPFGIGIFGQPDLKYVALPKSGPYGVSYQLNISPISGGEAKERALPLQFEARLMIKFENKNSQNVSQLAIYHFNEESKKWLYVGAERVDDKIVATISEPGSYALMENNDHTPPQIEVTVEHQSFIDGSYISQTPVISAQISDENGIDVRANRLMVFKDGAPVDDSEYTYSVSPTKSNMVLLSYTPTLSPGRHNISVQAFDANNLSTQKSISAEVAKELEIKNVANYPNPFEPGKKERNKGTIFAYILTAPADKLTLKIYTVTGRLVKAIDDIDAFAGYNEYHWNGLDEDEEELSNGVYFYKLIAQKDKKSAKKTGKLAILR